MYHLTVMDTYSELNLWTTFHCCFVYQTTMLNLTWSGALWKALAFPLLVQQIFFISPIVRDAKKPGLIVSKYLSIYSYIYLTIHIALLLIFVYFGLHRTRNTIKEIGYIWYTLSVLDFVMSKFTFITNVILSNRNKHHQLRFFMKTGSLDSFLAEEFGVHNKYKKITIGSVITICGCAVYATIATILSWHKLEGIAIDNFWLRLSYGFPYFIDKLTLTLITNTHIVRTLIVYDRYCALRRIMMEGKQRNFESILKLFSDISELGDLLNQYSNVIMFTRFSHDFMLCTSTTYLLCELYISGNTFNVNWLALGSVLYINYARVFMVAMSAEFSQREVGIL